MSLRSCVLICLLISGVYTLHTFLPAQEECQQQGLQCSKDCSGVVMCPPSGPPALIENCTASGHFCSVINDTPQCSDKNDCPKQTISEVLCGADGVFPNPYNCSANILCVSLIYSAECICPEGFYWNTKVSACTDDKPGLARCCSTQAKNYCDVNHIDGILGEGCDDDGYFYACAPKGNGEYRMLLYRCEPGEIYNTVIHKCEAVKRNDRNFGVKRQPTCYPITTTTPTTVTTPTTPTTVTIPTTPTTVTIPTTPTTVTIPTTPTTVTTPTTPTTTKATPPTTPPTTVKTTPTTTTTKKP